MRFPCWSMPWKQLADSPSSGGLLAFSTYYQLGGLEKVLALRAEAESIRLPETSQAVFSKVMDLLITVPPDPECRSYRRTTLASDLLNTDASRMFVNAFIANRFFTSDYENGRPVVRIAHEALLRRWDRLEQWLQKNRDQLQAREVDSRKGAADGLLLNSGLPLARGEEFCGAAVVKYSRGAKWLRWLRGRARWTVTNASESLLKRLFIRRVPFSLYLLTLVWASGGITSSWSQPLPPSYALRRRRGLLPSRARALWRSQGCAPARPPPRRILLAKS